MNRLSRLYFILSACLVCPLVTLAGPPYAFTQGHWAVTSTLNGMAGPAGLPSVAWFEWGATLEYGQVTPPTPIGSSSGVVRLSRRLKDLAAGHVYHARLVVSNAAGVTLGKDQPLITPGSTRIALIAGNACCGQQFPLPRLHNPCLPPATCNDGHPAPFPIPAGISNIVAISAGDLMLRSDGVALRYGEPIFNDVVDIAGGDIDPLALREDGTVLTSNGLVPRSASNVIAVAKGDQYNLALRADGRVVAWGDINRFAVTSVPGDVSNVVAIAAGSRQALALRIDGTVVAWGANPRNETDVPPGLTNVVAIAAGIDVPLLALRGDGSVIAFPASITRPPPHLTKVVAIAAGSTRFALDQTGRITQWDGDLHQSYFQGIVAIAAGGCGPVLALGANQAPISSLLSASGLQEDDLVVNLWGFDPNADSIRYRIAAPPELGELYQYDRGRRGARISKANVLVEDAAGRVIYVSQPGRSELESNFSFIVTDGELDSTPNRVALALTPRFPRIRIDVRECGTVEGFEFQPHTELFIRFGGSTNNTYDVSSSTNLLDWRFRGSAWPAFPGFLFVDYQPGIPGSVFYRITAR